MKLVWCPDTASKAYIDGVRAIAANNSSSSDGGGGGGCSSSPELAELVAAMAGGWNAQLIVDAPSAAASAPATSLALAAAARRTGGRYALLNPVHPHADAEDISPADSSTSSSAAAATEAAMSNLDGVDLLVLDARRSDAAAVLRRARPGARGMVVVRHGDTVGGGGIHWRRGGAATAYPWGRMAAGTRVVRAACLPIGGGGGVQVLHVGVGKGPSLPPIPTSTTTHGGGHGGGRRSSSSAGGGAGRGRWIRHVNHRTGEEHVFRRQ